MVGDSGTPAVAADGRLLSGRYRLLTVLGRGGAGIVWAAEDELLRRRVAVKEVVLQAVLPEVERSVLRERVLREARAAARVHDPGLVTVFDVVEEDGRPWIVMELVDAESLADAIRTRGPLPVPEVVEIGVAVAYALAAAHRAGVLHRDVKPGNVLLGRDGRVRLTDFGIASTAGDPTLTQTGMLLGSPSYIPPERARGKPASPASDVWGLGATLYAAVEGVPPYAADNPVAILTAVIEDRRRPPERAGPLAPLLSEMLALEEAARPSLARVRERLRPLARRVGEPGWAPVASAARPDPAPAAPAPVPPAPATSTERGASVAGGATRQEEGGGPAGWRRPRRRTAVLLGALAALGAALAVALVTVGGSDRPVERLTGAATRPPGAGSTGAPATGGPTGAPTTAPAPSTAATASPPASAPAAAPSGAAVPAGWTSYRGQRGWSVAHPADWRDRPAGGTDGVDLVQPGTGSYLHVDTLDRANPSAWRTGSGPRTASGSGTRATGGCGWSRATAATAAGRPTGSSPTRRAGRRCTCSTAGWSAMGTATRYWQTRASRWEDSQPLVRQLFASFQPAP